MREISKDNLLRSWKEIAAYLGCDVRTCHRWEDQRGMPVHRAEGSEKKSPVFAYKDELDAWFKGTFKTSDTTKIKVAPARPARPWVKWALAVAAVVVLAGAFFREGGLLVRRQPADFAIEGSFLVALDKHEQELWRWDSGYENLESEGFYRRNFQVIHKSVDNMLPVIVIRDIDADGDTEVLFAPRRQSDQTGEGWLYCLDRKGTERWRYRTGGPLVCGGKVYSPDYRLAGFEVHDHDGDGRLEIVVEAFHAPDWPCQLSVLDCEGKRVGEYWNAGYLRELAYQDIDGDGREELIVVGVNNEYRGGCLIVFDTGNIRGASPQTGDFACAGKEPGSELYYVTAPYTDVSAAGGYWVLGFKNVDIIEDTKWIRATSVEGLIVEFDFNLNALQVSWGHGFISAHEDGVKAGKITTVLDDSYRQMILAGIRYWNGAAFTAEPSPNTAGASGR
jgi:hypothetical protein